MKGKLPATGLITLESDKSLWDMFIRGLIKEVKTSGLIEINPEKKVRVKIVFEKIYSPKTLKTESQVISSQSTLGEFIAKGQKRIFEFLFDFLDKESWCFIGYFDGENQVPVMIIFYPNINLAIYSQKLTVESKQDFFPSLN